MLARHGREWVPEDVCLPPARVMRLIWDVPLAEWCAPVAPALRQNLQAVK